ncbi:MAG: lipoate--protein ligase family protein [bacterium]
MNVITEGHFNLIISGGCSGSFNMSADLSLLDRYKIADDFSSRPTLRIYYFSPPALSLGFFQKDKSKDKDIKAKDASESVIERAKNKGYDIVLRPTGGRAVLHKNEITYSITSSYKTGIFAGKLLETYKKAGEFLKLFFISLGLNPDANFPSGAASDNAKNSSGLPLKKNNFNCFLKAHSYEITFGGKKICGNSQRRSDTAFLQHGSIYIDYNPVEHIELFEDGDSNGNAEYFKNITGIKQEMKRAGIDFDLNYLGFDNLSKIMVDSFRNAYNLEPEPADLQIKEPAAGA